MEEDPDLAVLMKEHPEMSDLATWIYCYIACLSCFLIHLLPGVCACMHACVYFKLLSWLYDIKRCPCVYMNDTLCCHYLVHI